MWGCWVVACEIHSCMVLGPSIEQNYLLLSHQNQNNATQNSQFHLTQLFLPLRKVMKNQFTRLKKGFVCLLHLITNLFRYLLFSRLLSSRHLWSQSYSSIVCLLNSSNLFFPFAYSLLTLWALILLLRLLYRVSLSFFIWINRTILSLAVSRQASSTPFSICNFPSLLTAEQKCSMGLRAEYFPVLQSQFVSIVLSKALSGTKFSCFLSMNFLNFFRKQGFISSLYRSLSQLQTTEMERRWTRLLLRTVELSVSCIVRFNNGVVRGLNVLKVPQSVESRCSGEFRMTRFLCLFIAPAVNDALSGFFVSLSKLFSIAIYFYFTGISQNYQIAFQHLWLGFQKGGEQSYKIYIIMANRQKNNFNDRLKRLGCEELHKTLKNKNRAKTMYFDSIDGFPRENGEFSEYKRSLEMFQRMKGQIDTLTIKLEEMQKERERMCAEIQRLTAKIEEKDMESTYLSRQLTLNQRSMDMVKQKLETAESELQNLRLRQKMEAISNQISKQQPQGTTLKHQRHRKGKFSAALLPSAFGSQKKFEFHSPQMVRDEAKEQYFNSNQSILRSPFSGYLIEQWQRTKNQRNYKQLEVANLQTKITTLKKEIVRQNKQIESLKTDKPSNHELVAALEVNRQQQRRSKLIIMKLRESQKKRSELSSILKEKGEPVQEDKFYGFSTIADINDMIEKSGQNLEIDRNVIDISIITDRRQEKATQTVNLNYQIEKVSSLEILIQQLTEKMVSKEQQFKSKYLKMQGSYQQELQDYISQLQDHRIKIEEYSLLLSKYQNESVCSQSQKVSIAIECLLLSSNDFEQRQVILEKAKLLMEVNQQSKQQLKALESRNQQLSKQLESFKKEKNANDRFTQIQESFFIEEQDHESTCLACQNHKQVNYHLKEQANRLNTIIATISQERDHFKHCYEESLTAFKEMQQDSQKQIHKLSEENQEKEKTISITELDLQQKIHEIERYKSQVNELEVRLHEQEEMRQKMHRHLLQNSTDT